MAGEGKGPRGERLGGATILLTGGSGFLGMAVLSALLTHAPGFGRLILLLRAADDAAAQRRLTKEVLGNEAFATLPADWLRGRLERGEICAVAGDLASEETRAPSPKDWGRVDTLINCAASVSFEEPLDDALALNAFGPARLVEGLRQAGSDPYVVHVSTAYVADCGAEVVYEDALPHPALGSLDPSAMVAEAQGWRQAVESAATGAEEQRQRWVKLKLSERGRQEACAVGWPDTYTLTKALGERELSAVTERITIVRPSIIESSLRTPRPGWLEGVKVADPLILAYAAGGLTHLAGRASNLIDVVPVDCVANACVAAAANPGGGRPRVLAISSTARNPLRIGELAGHIKAHFRRQPLQRGGGAVRIGDLEFADRAVAVGRTARRERLARLAAKAAVGPVPEARKKRLRRNAALAAQMTRMVKIYAPYTELDCVFDDANACALAASLSDADRAQLPFDTAAIDWTEYLEGVHLPEVQRMATRRA